MDTMGTRTRTRTALAALAALAFFCVAARGAVDSAVTVVPEYQNPVSLAGDHAPYFACYGGHVLTTKPAGSTGPGAVPSSDSFMLMQSGFGQPVSAAVYPDFVNDTLKRAQDLLYYNTVPGASGDLNALAAFRYKVYLYSRDPDTAKVRADFHGFDNMYGEAERIRAATAESLVLEALRYSPMNSKIWNVLLDIYYDRAVAEIQFIKMRLANLSALRLGLTASKPNQTELVIDREIDFYKQILEGHEHILAQYSKLFTEPFGIDVHRYDPGAEPDVRIGYYVFKGEVPFRSLHASQFRDTDGVVKTVPDRYGNPLDPQEPLFAGHKDYVLLLQVLRDYARDAAQLVQDYALRGRRGIGHDDYEEAGNLVNRVQTELVFGKTVLEGMFPGYPPEGDPDNAGVGAALQGVAVGLGDLSEMKGFLKGDVNFLGFDPDFLVLIQEYPLQIPEGNRFDSYDAIIAWLGQEYSPLKMAQLTYMEAKDSYQSYRGYADQVYNELSSVESTYNEEYFRIVGANPDDPTYNVLNPAPGSDLELANQRIAGANVKMASLSARARVLTEHIEKAVDFRDNAANEKVHAVDTALANYKGKVAGEWDCIRDWSAAQAGTQAAFDMTAALCSIDVSMDPVSWVAGGVDMALVTAAGVANIAVQTEGEMKKGDAEKQIDFAQAEYQKDLALVDVALLQNEAESRLTDLEEEQISISVDMSETLSILNQESASRNLLIRRASRSQQLLKENQQRVADRYYADPIHYMRAQDKVIEAELAFRKAQQWAFFAARALEYKYNKKFEHSYLDRDWQISTLFQLRNYDELDNFFAAMNEFNLINAFNLVGRNAFTDRLSVREHFWMLPDTVVDGGVSRPAQYFSEDGTQLLSSVEKFRENLRSMIDRNNQIVIQLDTSNLQKADGAYFVGPAYSDQGCVIQAGKWLDKVEWIKFNLVGDHPERTFTGGDFSYGGNTYVRTLVPPCPETPLSLPGDWMVYPFRYFFTLDNGATWQARDSQAFTPIMRFSHTSTEPVGTDFENRALKERSVAASRITLRIPASEVNIGQLNDIELYIRHFFADRISPVCPGCSAKPAGEEAERG
jgi:hypothetical protein